MSQRVGRSNNLVGSGIREPKHPRHRASRSTNAILIIALATIVSLASNNVPSNRAEEQAFLTPVRTPLVGPPDRIAGMLPATTTGRTTVESPTPSIAIEAVRVEGGGSNYSIDVLGYGFGTAPKSMPYFGDLPYFRIADDAQYGHGEWGYSGDANELTYESWNNTQVIVYGLSASPGDALALALWNPSTGLGATWGGNVPKGASGAPIVSSVRFTGSGQSLGITVNGTGFGATPFGTVNYSGTLDYFEFMDAAGHCGAGSLKFDAGFSGWGIGGPDTVTLNYTSWSPTQIVISGFSGTYGSGCATDSIGDPVFVAIWNSSDSSVTGLQTAWGGFIGTSGPGLLINATASTSSGAAPLAVTFNSVASGGQSPYSYNWTFGDGGSASGPLVRHVYSTPGTYNALVIVTDSAGRTGQASLAVVVFPPGGGQNGSLEIGISANPVTGPAPLNTSFSATVTDGVPPYTISWSFGDGSPIVSGSSVNHTYTTAGLFSVALQVNDSAGNRATTGVFVTVGSALCLPRTLSVLVRALKLSGSAPLTVTFAPLIECGAPVYRLLWDFGDGTTPISTSGQGSVSHVYSESGTFFPDVQVTDSLGDSGNWSALSSPLGTQVVVAATSVTVPPINHSPSKSQSITLAEVVLGISLAVLVAILVFVTMTRRGRPLQSDSDQNTLGSTEETGETDEAADADFSPHDEDDDRPEDRNPFHGIA